MSALIVFAEHHRHHRRRPSYIYRAITHPQWVNVCISGSRVLICLCRWKSLFEDLLFFCLFNWKQRHFCWLGATRTLTKSRGLNPSSSRNKMLKDCAQWWIVIDGRGFFFPRDLCRANSSSKFSRFPSGLVDEAILCLIVDVARMLIDHGFWLNYNIVVPSGYGRNRRRRCVHRPLFVLNVNESFTDLMWYRCITVVFTA